MKKIKNICPNCGEQLNIDSIGYAQRGDMIYFLNIIDGKLSFEFDEFDSNEAGIFFCRSCGLELPKEYQDITTIEKLIKRSLK